MAYMGMACHVPRATRVRDHTERDARAGNAANYQTPVFNFAPTWESIYLNFDLDAAAQPISGVAIS